MKSFLLLIGLTVTNVFTVVSQDLPTSYPSHIFKFSLTDSSEFRPIYDDHLIRDSLKRHFGRGNRHRESAAVEEYQLKAQKVDFLSRHNNPDLLWNIVLTSGDNTELYIPRNSEIADYTFEHFHESSDLIVFREQWGEGNGYMIVDRKSGSKVRTWGPPVFSPDRDYFISFQADIDAHYSNNGIQLFKIVNGIPELQLEYAMDWGPTKVEWLNNKTFKLEIYNLEYLERGVVEIFKYYEVVVKKSDP